MTLLLAYPDFPQQGFQVEVLRGCQAFHTCFDFNPNVQ